MPLKKKNYNSDDPKVASLSHWALFYEYNPEYLSGNNSFFRKSREILIHLDSGKRESKASSNLFKGFSIVQVEEK